MKREQLTILLRQLMSNGLSPEEQASLKDFIERPENRELFVEVADELNRDHVEAIPYSEESWKTIISQVIQIDRPIKPVTGYGASPKPVHRIHLLKTAWFRYAAAVMIITGIGAYLYESQRLKPVPNEMAIVKDVPAPKTNRATLTLANGEQIFLDSADNGTLAVQGSVDVQKMNDGRIVYTGKQKRGAIQYNTISVPRGSQIASIVLSDGTKVFLNSASSLKYPVSFADVERRVEIKGEAYFEVARDKQRRFVVVSDKSETQVLGTHFNVNAYPDEASTKITLLEGSVKVSSNKKDVILQPGQQVEIAGSDSIRTNNNVNISQIVAWQKGMFLFSQMDLRSMMRQISRWYNVSIEYRGNVKPRTFGGGVSRRSPLSEVIKILESNGVPCALNGSTLIIGK